MLDAMRDFMDVNGKNGNFKKVHCYGIMNFQCPKQ